MNLDRLAKRGAIGRFPTRRRRRPLITWLGDLAGMLALAALVWLLLYATGVTQPQSAWLVARHPITGAEIRICARDEKVCKATIRAIFNGWWGRDLEDYAITCEPTADDCTRGE